MLVLYGLGQRERELAPLAAAATSTSTMISRRLLTAGALAGPVYLVVGLAQALTRPGFDLTRHDLSLLSIGDLGWIQITNFVVSGGLVIAGALGMRRVLRPGRAGTWGPLLVGVYGLGLIGAGFFVADPVSGFPPGTAVDAPTFSSHGLLHFASGGMGFLGLIAATLVFARRFAALGQRDWAAYSVMTGVLFLLGFVGIASGSGDSWTVLGFWLAVVLAWAWLTAMTTRMRSELTKR